jgi:RHS repeat-associated protein
MTAVRRYYRGHDLVTMRDVAANQSRVYHFDHQGTTQCLTDQTGAVTDRFASDAWGAQVKRTGTSINRQWYIGRSGYDRGSDSSVYYVRARWYQSSLGQWLSCDPRREAFAGRIYSANRPAMRIDPSGLFSIYRHRCQNRRGTIVCLDPNDQAHVAVGAIGQPDPNDPLAPLSMNPLTPKEAWDLCIRERVIGAQEDCAIINASFFDPKTFVILGKVKGGCGEKRALHTDNSRIPDPVTLPSNEYVYGKPLRANDCKNSIYDQGNRARNIAFRQAGSLCVLIIPEGAMTPAELCKCLYCPFEAPDCGAGLAQGQNAVQLDGGSSVKLCFAQGGHVRCQYEADRKYRPRVPSYIVMCGARQEPPCR